MKPIIATFILFTTPAFAHVGHLGEVAGHGHWIAAGALGAAALAAWLASKGRKTDAKDAENPEGARENPEDSAENPEEAPA